VKERTALRYALWSGASALTVALLLTPVAWSRGAQVVGWGLFGWLLTSLAGVFGGMWIVAKHGRRGRGFLVALGVCMLARLVLFVAGPLAVATRGTDVMLACLAGLFAGYLPTQATEIVWFARKAARA